MSRLDTLFADLDALPDLSAEVLLAWLEGSGIGLEDVASLCRFNADRYVRNLVRRGAGYDALALCWRNGQRSPIHDHENSRCAVKVLSGEAIETTFHRAPNGMVYPTGSRTLTEGATCYSENADLHQMSNLQPNGADLVTLHIYTPPLLNMSVFSIDGAEPQTYCDPIHMGLTSGAGI